MPRYLIHTCPQRLWYVNDYLIPSMQEQGIEKEKIVVYYDKDCDGHLKSFINSIDYLPDDKGTWHLQDDVVISSRFKELTEEYDEGIVCGFCNQYSDSRDCTGRVNVNKMWYSMPCIRITNRVLKEFKKWFEVAEVQQEYKPYISGNKHSDVLFWGFLKERYRNYTVMNLSPNIVNHIDHLIGGSVLNKNRAQGIEYIMSMYWEEPQLIEELAERLKNEQDIKNNVI